MNTIYKTFKEQVMAQPDMLAVITEPSVWPSRMVHFKKNLIINKKITI